MRIGINIDGVLRNLIGKLVSTHTKYYDGEVDINNIVDYELEKYFDFTISGETSGGTLTQFFYEDCSLEIFGYANEIEDQIVKKLNDFIKSCGEDNKVILLTRECGRAIPSTLFFLSKTGSMCKNIKVIPSYKEMWDECDILITTFPEVLKTKPEGKVSIKIEREYNKKDKSDYSSKSTTEVLEEGYIEKIINTKTVEYKELN
jgi:5'(3')-deoxyribonucleotidase